MEKAEEKDARAPDVENTNDEARQGKVRRGKTRDADYFELEYLNEDKLLQEKFLMRKLVEKGIRLPYADDNTVLLNYNARLYEKWDSATITKKTEELNLIMDLIEHYIKIFVHAKLRLERISDKLIKIYVDSDDNNIFFKEKLRRVHERIDDYIEIRLLFSQLFTFADDIIFENRKTFDERYRREVGERIRKARLAKDKTQKETALKIGVSRSMLSQFETGIREISLPAIKRLLCFLDVSANDIL